MFDPRSRYAKLTPYAVIDRRGRVVCVIPATEVPPQTVLGRHLRKQVDRLDHLAGFYLADPAGYWRLSELNDAMLPESLSEALELLIPEKKG
jgi:hypothetical protein